MIDLNVSTGMQKNKLNCIFLIVAIVFSSCSMNSSRWEEIDEEGSFLVHRRQSLIGEETFNISSNEHSIIVKSLQGENERGRITGVVSELRLTKELIPTYYESRRITRKDTTNILKIEVGKDKVTVWEKEMEVVEHTALPAHFFLLHSNIPAGMETMLYHYIFKHGIEKALPTYPRGETTIAHTGKDTISINKKSIVLDRYVVEGINWGGRTIWLDESKNLIALVKANTQIREMIRKGYEEALPVFIAGNVTEQMNALSNYTKNLKKKRSLITAIVGADLIDGLSDIVRKNVTIIIENDRIVNISDQNESVIPKGADVIDAEGKILIPGLWDMHAHSNQVQWAPAYLAGGVTTIRDNGNEIEFATAFRDAIDKDGALGPDILLGGMTDGAGIKGNGVIRATTPSEAREVVKMYHSLGYKQIKIYTSVEPEIVKVLCEEAHKLGMTTTGHVPNAVENTIDAVNYGMDQLSHSGRILSVLYPNKKLSELRGSYLVDNGVSDAQIKEAQKFLLKHKTVLDPTIALLVVRNLPKDTPIEVVEPDAHRIAYELFEGKRFRSGISPEAAEKAKKDYKLAMEVLGRFYKAGVPMVAGTDNVVPVFSLYLEIETYHKLGGLTALEAIQTATIVPARAMGMEAETGTIEIGKQADIAFLDKNPLIDISNIRTVSAVMTNGNYYISNPLWRVADFKPREK
ncbi:MAG: imidazolonepropionase-like amidohydrolase [Saprospiraceae bacterium]|jgi:imidazolonepropionase-like amidohydrolase